MTLQMPDTQQALLKILSDGAFHSGESLGECLGISRAAVWKQLRQLDSYGLEVERHKGRGYRLAGGLSLLDDEVILRHISAPARASINRFSLFAQMDSTNQYLLEHLDHGHVCLCEQQTAGRGRRGRQWISPYGSNVYLSIAWGFSQGIAALEGLSLAVGVAVVDALNSLGCHDVSLKWPNDVLVNKQKLAGVLLELAGDASGDCFVVVGVGLNVNMPLLAGRAIDQPWTALQHLPGAEVNRNLVAARLLQALLLLLKNYEGQGFKHYRDRWEQLNAHKGQQVELLSPGKSVVGNMLGVSETGALRLEVEGREQVFLGGEISVRPR